MALAGVAGLLVGAFTVGGYRLFSEDSLYGVPERFAKKTIKAYYDSKTLYEVYDDANGDGFNDSILFDLNGGVRLRNEEHRDALLPSILVYKPNLLFGRIWLGCELSRGESEAVYSKFLARLPEAEQELKAAMAEGRGAELWSRYDWWTVATALERFGPRELFERGRLVMTYAWLKEDWFKRRRGSAKVDEIIAFYRTCTQAKLYPSDRRMKDSIKNSIGEVENVWVQKGGKYVPASDVCKISEAFYKPLVFVRGGGRGLCNVPGTDLWLALGPHEYSRMLERHEYFVRTGKPKPDF